MKIVIISPFQIMLKRGIERYSFSLANKLVENHECEIIIYAWEQRNNDYFGIFNKKIRIRKVPNIRYFIRVFAGIYYRIWLKIDKPDIVILNFLYHGEENLPARLKYFYVLHSPASQIPQRTSAYSPGESL